MKIEIAAKNYRVTTDLDKVLEKKLSKLDKYFDDDATCKVYLKKEKRDSKMEVSLERGGLYLRAQANGENFYDIIDAIVPKLERQIYKYRSKLEKKLKTGVKIEKLEPSAEADEFKLVKTKQFEVKPMSIDEAIEEFELIGHSFFVYLDADDNKIKVLYLRDDGNIGLINPVIK